MLILFPFCYQCYYQHLLRDLVCPVCGTFIKYLNIKKHQRQNFQSSLRIFVELYIIYHSLVLYLLDKEFKMEEEKKHCIHRHTTFYEVCG